MTTENLERIYFVYGGEFVNTKFEDLVNGTEEKYGPFTSYALARNTWWERTCMKVDNCHHRLTIVDDPSFNPED